MARFAAGLSLFTALCAFLLSGCGKPPPPAPAPIEVKVMAVIQRDTQLTKDFVGEVRGSQEVDLRARVSGVVMKKHFLDGALVREGQVLFSIDPREYKAQLANAEAQLAAAQANLSRANQDVERYKPLVAENAISRQVYDNAVAAAGQAAAQVDATRAGIAEANLGVEYATVRAPLTGRIGAAQVFEGSLVTAGTTPLATLSTDDPAWVTFSISEADYLTVLKRFGDREPPPDDAARRVRLFLSDGSEYSEGGMVNFEDRSLDPKTGTYALRATFPNHQHALRPGLFARIRASGEYRAAALMVPDRAIVEQLGRYFVTVVGAGNKAEPRPVQLGPRSAGLVVVDNGLKLGDIVVVEGTLKARPGSILKPIPVTEAELAKGPQAPPMPGAGDAKSQAAPK
jgi:membrane fusion protein (multidrug efflux system)